MLKKIVKFLKFIFVCFVWSVVWFTFMREVVFSIWNFDFFSTRQWQMVASFWNAHGTIKGLSDYMLFLSMFVTLLLWFLGLRRLYKVDYWQLLLKPFQYFSSKQIEKYKKEGKHVVIKNLVVGEKITLNDLIDEKIKEEGKKQEAKESENLRQNIAQKIIERKGQ